MAEHGQVEYAVAEGNDLAAHEETYERFVHLAFVGALHVVNVVIGLAIGAVNHHWLVAFVVMVLATLVAIQGFARGSRAPSAVMVVLALLALGLTAGGGSSH
ncbi:MAG: aa3-type cytochrome c oxidase subunit IV [Xanthobacteraceae bacterium]